MASQIRQFRQQQQQWFQQMNEEEAPPRRNTTPAQRETVPEADTPPSESSSMESGKCPICYELMVSPRRPMLLFPCGHCLCQLCLEQVQGMREVPQCPTCRADIVSTAPNISLQNLIMDMRQDGFTGLMGLADYQAQLTQLDRRIRILEAKKRSQAESGDATARLQELADKERSLTAEADSLSQKIAQLEAQRSSVRDAASEARREIAAIERNSRSALSETAQVDGLLAGLHQERRKVALLIKGLGR
ncbi:Zinc finger, C3HC4 type (RING finger) [Carpediemonas membranifera]|uniref:Zinc finger, C3HC4 type (RING finger) n=1 Tax=Carpediemonas membranifera TaxID=201153 RepID=A0A8J6AS83_9EUKA|nr:Zinc finger, C3HC4 type (RING finger) [Carpediemonas membranifera]|eukprot:KAG9391010.1 Zinc finger, C3HC4 type (RING finger) [Carpediemonas membranifera]